MVDYQAFKNGLSSQGLTDFLTQSISEASAAESSDANYEELIKKYHSEELDESCLPSDPLSFFRQWFTQAIACGIGEANAMCLATVDPETMRPSARMVLLKELESECEEGATDVGFVFYTNYESRKSVDLERNPQVGSWAVCSRCAMLN
jgi:pyridoxine/pyridoxamine 5'-phosphate oxidase